MTIGQVNYTSQDYDYFYNETTMDYDYELVNTTESLSYYLETDGQWRMEGNSWIYDNVTPGMFVWNMTTLQSSGLSEYASSYGLQVSITGTNYDSILSTNNPSLERLSGKIDYSSTPNQTITIALSQEIYKNDNITYSNNTILDLFADRVIDIGGYFYYFPETIFPMNITEIELPLDESGYYKAPEKAILLTNMSKLTDYLTTYNQSETLIDYINQNINFTFTVLLPELALGDIYKHTELGYLTLNRSIAENWVVHSYALRDTLTSNKAQNYPNYQLYFATGLDSHYNSPDTLFIFELVKFFN